jgi:hypothetical protein
VGSTRWRDAVGLLAALLIGVAAVAYHHKAHYDPHVVWDGFTLPGFDAHVYVAMAEEPRVFTVGPWGYRILLPGILSFLPPRLIVPGFEWAARVSLVVASGLLFLYLRRLGGTTRAALLMAAAVMATPSVSAVFANPFLVEPFALVLLLLALLAIEGGAGMWTTGLTLMLLALTKEIWVLLLPPVYLRERRAGPDVRAALSRTLQTAAPALWIAVVLRAMWAPQLSAPAWSGAGAGAEAPAAAVAAASPIGTILRGLAAIAPEFLLGGFALAALAGLLRPGARVYLREHALPVLALLALPIVAAAYTGAGAATSFFGDDVRRLLVYVLPFAAALAVHLDPAHGPVASLAGGRAVPRVSLALIGVLALAPLALDRYWRVDLGVTRDGPYLLGFARETIRTARRLERGETVVFDPAVMKFAWGVSPASDLPKMRFFLRNGFGDIAHYGIHDMRMRERQATLVIPLMAPRTLRLTLTLDARTSTWMSVSAGGEKMGEALIGPEAVAVTIEIPAAKLFRGDNPITLDCAEAPAAVPRLLRIEIAPAP